MFLYCIYVIFVRLLCFCVIANAVVVCVPAYGHDIGDVEGWTVTCWWRVTYRFLQRSNYQHVSNIKAGQGRGCRTAQPLNHLHDFFTPTRVRGARHKDALGRCLKCVSVLRSHPMQENNISGKTLSCRYSLNQAHTQTDAVWKTEWGS